MNKVNGKRYKRTLYVGLGGAGAKVLTELKRGILEANSQKIPKQVKFLLIDTNATELSNYNNFDASEKICIAVREPHQRYQADKGKHTHEYIPEVNSYSLLALERGAGQVRSNGHFAVIENQYSNKLMRIFHDRADELMNIDIDVADIEKDPKIEVRVVFSLAGGTGSGTFLPISLLLRSAIKHCELIGYAISPFHYERTVENSAKKTVMANGYAALSELDYMMHFGRTNINQENIKFNFGPDINTQQIEQFNRPFDEVYYIDKRTNLPLSDSIEYTYNDLGRMLRNTADIIHLASTNIISGHTGTVDNVRQKIHEGQFDVEDKFGWVSGVGMAEIYLDPAEKESIKIREAAKGCIDIRVAKTNLTKEEIDVISTDFIGSDWNESDKDGDEDRVIESFLSKTEIDKIPKLVGKNNLGGNSNGTPSSFQQFDFGTLVEKDKHKSVSEIEKDRLSTFQLKLDNFIKDSFSYPMTSNTGTTSIYSIIDVLNRISEKLIDSINQLGKESELHEAASASANDNWRELATNAANANAQVNQLPKPSIWGRLFGNNNNHTPNQIAQNNQGAVIQAQLILDAQGKALQFEILKDRAIAAQRLLKQCNQMVESSIDVLNGWCKMLKNASSAGDNLISLSENKENTVEPANRVKVDMASVHNGYVLSFDDIVSLDKYRNTNIAATPNSIFDEICKILSVKTGSLREYLIQSIKELDSIDGDKKTRGRQEKTECQKAIDQLIDLSAPTMQIDAHGYGARIKADQFYYIMTSDEEIEFSDEEKKDVMKSTSTLGGIKHKTVAGLLQYLLEQNSQDIHVNRVNVSGWENKAVLYRVKGAIPPYFIDGVAEGPLGGQTMERCYEELKKTRAAYTPFSHTTLRQKLENGISVLRPHDSTSEEEAMEHWVNFMMLTAFGQHGYIKFIPEDSETYVNCSRQLGAKGSYSISSKHLGSIQTGELADRTPILVLGNNRADAFHMFARYCKDILEEHKDYIDRMKHFEYCGIAKQMVEMTGEKYMDTILSGWDHLFFDEEDQELLRREMDYIETRRKKFEDTLKGRSLKRTIVETHEKDSEESSCDDVQVKDEINPE